MELVHLQFQAPINFENRGDYWAAKCIPMGITSYGDTKERAIKSLTEAINLFILTFAPGNQDTDAIKLGDYLNSRGIKATINRNFSAPIGTSVTSSNERLDVSVGSPA